MDLFDSLQVKSDFKICSLRIVPPIPVFTEIVGLKKQFEAVFEKQLLSKSKPHISIATFIMDMQDQDILLRNFNQLACIDQSSLDLGGYIWVVFPISLIEIKRQYER